MTGREDGVEKLHGSSLRVDVFGGNEQPIEKQNEVASSQIADTCPKES
jgi:hypothetical protein